MQINGYKLYILSNYRPEYPLNSFNYVSVQSTFIGLYICVCVCVCVITRLLVWCVVGVHANACAIHR